MFGIERLQAIRELVKEKKSVEVTHLSKELNVSEVTIRRDLDKLEKEGLVAKTYGGAILIEDQPAGQMDSMEVQAAFAGDVTNSEYDAIAATAAKIIESGDTVFIGGGEAGIPLCRALKDLEDLILVTTNLEIAMYIYANTPHKLVMIGGEIDEASGNVMDYDQLDELLIEKAFITVEGVDMQVGYTVNEKTEVRLYKSLKRVTRTMALMAPSGLYNKRGLMKMAPMSDIGSIVTDKDLPDDYKAYYYDNNIKVYTSMLS